MEFRLPFGVLEAGNCGEATPVAFIPCTYNNRDKIWCCDICCYEVFLKEMSAVYGAYIAEKLHPLPSSHVRYL